MTVRSLLTAAVAAAALVVAFPGVALAANPIQTENALPGTAGWNVPNIVPGLLEGYADRISALPGDTVNLKVSTTSSAGYRVEVYRLGWYGGAGGRLMTCVPSCSGSKAAISQPYPTPDPVTGLARAGWTTTDSFTVGANWVSGYYIAQLKLTSGSAAGSAFTIPLLVRPPASRAKVMLVQASSNTWQAYNKWGGKSLYNSNSTGGVHADKVSFDRPFHRESQSLYNYDLQLVRFLEREGYDVAYQSDTDTHDDPPGLRGYRLVASAGHDEYWTKEMRDAFEGARDAGVNLAFFGANSAYWQMRVADAGRTIVEYKDRSDDPEPDQRLKTIQFRTLIPARPECQLMGVQYEGAISNNAYRAYRVTTAGLADPWLAGTGFTAGATVPLIVGYEWDVITPGCAVPGTPKALLHYDGGTAEPSADAVRYTAPSGARVFAAGTLNWSWRLDSYLQDGVDAVGHTVDARIQALTRNVLNDLTATSGGGNQPPVASFTRDVAAPTAGQAVTFTDTSTDSDGTITARAWDLDDDGQYDDGTGATAQHTFATAGTHTVGLRVTDDSGAGATTSTTFTVTAPGTPGQWTVVQHRGLFSSASATTLALAPASALTSGDLVVVAVAWGDQTSTPVVTDTRGNVYTATGPAARYAGSRSVQLFYAKNVLGGATTVTATFPVAVANRFVAVNEYSGIDTAAPLVATATGNAGSGTSSAVPVTTSAAGQLIVAVNQNGAAGISSVTGNAPTLLDTGSGGNVGDAHDSAATAGANAITFRFAAGGAWATAVAAFRPSGVVPPANTPPVASFTRDVAAPTAGQAVTFTDTSTDSDGTITARAWDLDDDGQYDDGTGATAQHTFATAGTHTVGLRVTDDSGAGATTSTTFTVTAPGTPWAMVQHRGSFASGTATSLALTPVSALGAGHLVVVAVAWGSQSVTATVTDSRGTTYTPVGSPTPYSGSRFVQLFYARNVAAGAATVTASFSAAVGNRFVGISEYSGMDQLSPLVGSGGASGGGAPTGAATVIATAPGQLVVAVEQNGAGGITSVTGNTPTLLDTGSGGNVGSAMDASAAAGANAITFHHAQTGAWAVASAVFAPAGL